MASKDCAHEGERSHPVTPTADPHLRSYFCEKCGERFLVDERPTTES